jgi:hypothetical protein
MCVLKHSNEGGGENQRLTLEIKLWVAGGDDGSKQTRLGLISAEIGLSWSSHGGGLSGWDDDWQTESDQGKAISECECLSFTN